MKPQNSGQMILSALNPILNKARFYCMTQKYDSHDYILLVHNNVWFAFKSFALKEARNVRCKIGIQKSILESGSFLKSSFCREWIYHRHLKIKGQVFPRSIFVGLTWSASCIYRASFAIGEAASPNPTPLTTPKPANSIIVKVFMFFLGPCSF